MGIKAKGNMEILVLFFQIWQENHLGRSSTHLNYIQFPVSVPHFFLLRICQYGHCPDLNTLTFYFKQRMSMSFKWMNFVLEIKMEPQGKTKLTHYFYRESKMV